MNEWIRKVDSVEQAKAMGLLLLMENERLDKQKQENLEFLAKLEKEWGLEFEKPTD